MQKTILLTGASGFIGSNLLRYLFDKYPDYYFLVLDAMTYAGNQKNIPDYIKNSKRYEFWYGDVTNPYIVGELVSRSNYIVHLAAETHVARSIFDNSKFFHTDVIGTQTMLNALLKAPQVEKFIHISTSEVYGTATSHIMDEKHILNPQSPYAGAKAGADRLVYSYWSTYSIPAMIIRPFNNYGPQQHLEKAIPRFITSALKNEPLTIHGAGTAERDWVYVEDHCRALDYALNSVDFSKIKNETINIGSGISTSILDIAKQILKELNRSESLLTFIGDRPGQVEKHISTTQKAQDLLGWKARYTLEKGLSKTIEWYVSNTNLWKDSEWMKEVPIHTTNGKLELH